MDADALKIDCTLHKLRHTHVSQLIAAGLDVLTISRQIGHASAAITLNVYGHLFSNTDTCAADIMEATFAKKARASQAWPVRLSYCSDRPARLRAWASSGR
jgi:integrase